MSGAQGHFLRQCWLSRSSWGAPSATLSAPKAVFPS
ncbi:SCAMP4 isoform 11 [Pan troglodytes]|uniref:Secretory carrier membrane protein 4 n=2 Tax=Homininae TaxID=207598 RepID=A0A087WYP4_HUMAN|nr:SCAMP4 isoform 11 [Pan troglodytes]